jgi:hypothetical protein
MRGILVSSLSFLKKTGDNGVSGTDETVLAKITSGQSYLLNLSGLGNASISRQSSNFLITQSELLNEAITLSSPEANIEETKTH